LSTATNGSKIPSVDVLESQLHEASRFRGESLQELYQQITDQSATADDIDALRGELTDSLASRDLAADIERITETYPQVNLEALQETIDDANTADKPLPEEAFANSALRSNVETLANGRTLLETPDDGDSLHTQLEAVNDELPDSPDGFVAQQIANAVSGANIPTPDRAKQLLGQGRAILAGDDDDDGEGTDTKLWQQLSGYDDGTIVIIETEADQ
jgi:hypothetical protein